jgi:hypothetical protein
MRDSAGVTDSQLKDLIISTLAKQLPLSDIGFDVAFENNQYEVVNRWLQSDKIQIDSGTQIERRVMLDKSGTAQWVHLYERTDPNKVDLMSKLVAPWRQMQTYWMVERRELLRNRKPEKLVDLLTEQRVGAMVSMADKLEADCVTGPATLSDDRTAWGLQYAIGKAEDSTGEGYYGGIHSDFADIYGIVPATSGSGTSSIAGGKSLWRNWCAPYTAVDASLLKKIRTAYYKIHFKSPVIARDLVQGPASNYRLYANVETLVQLEELAEQRNQNLGRDLGQFQNATTFRGVPFVALDALDDDADDPIYMVNHSHFVPFVMESDYMRESEPMNTVFNHNVFVTFVDLSVNFLLRNRRQQACVCKV